MNQAEAKKRPAWMMVLRGSIALAIIAVVVYVVGCLAQSSDIVQVSFWAFAVAAIGLVGSAVTYVATR